MGGGQEEERGDLEFSLKVQVFLYVWLCGSLVLLSTVYHLMRGVIV